MDVVDKIVNVHEAKTHLSRLLEDVERGRQVVIARAGKPVARLVAISGAPGKSFGSLRGKIHLDETFYERDEALERAFEGP